MDNQLIKIKYNVTLVTFNCYKKDGDDLVTETHHETILYKRDKRFLENYLKRKYKNVIAIELVDYSHHSYQSTVPLSVALEYASEV